MAHRIGSFQRQLPEVTLHLHISHLEPNFTRERVALGVYWGHGLWQNLYQEQLMTLEYTARVQSRITQFWASDSHSGSPATLPPAARL